MRGVYLSSVRSPALGSRYRMVHREFNPQAVFSQIPEQDSAYAEDSFCVGDDEEEAQSGCSEQEEEEECVNLELLSPQGLSSSRRRCLTRCRTRLDQGQKKKPSRIIVLSDSSEEETGASREQPLGAEQGKGQLPQDTGRLLGAAGLHLPPEQPGRSTSIPKTASGCRSWDLQAAAEVSAQGQQGPSSLSLAGNSGVPAGHSLSLAGNSRVPAGHSPSPCILADSREISSGPGVISCLRAVHGLRVQVCSLGTSDYIVSSRLAVDRLFQSELQSPGNRNKLSQRLQRLQGAFERICVIVETDRVRPGETSRIFQRTQYYDGVLSALVQAGIRILFSSCQEETAALLKDLALLEHRKDAAIQVPTEPRGHGRDILSFYLSIPNLSYGAALNLCHSFGSITAVANSSVPALAAGARLSQPQAEELHLFLRHDFDLQLLPQPPPAKGKS
ncbi:FANCM protein, partial [Hylia prasina]|nr:FANCM protein [Hylia prasina]